MSNCIKRYERIKIKIYTHFIRYQKMQLDWKVRNEKLEEELLFIKQLLLLKKLPVPSPDSSPVQEYAQRLGMI